MLNEMLLKKRCIMVCGGGGVGKTTIAASIAIAAAKIHSRVLVVTIDPAKRLLQAFGFKNAFTEEGGEPVFLSLEVKEKLGLGADSNLSIAVLNPKYVLNQILEQTLTPMQQERLKRTVLFAELSQMIYGLQEYTAYEWVTRMIQNNEYDLIVLDTPPAFHAKDFFNAPEKIRNLMESRVFQLFLPKKTWLGNLLSFGWVEKLLGNSLFGESKVFFEMFTSLRTRILERCESLSKFFKNHDVAVIAVSTVESSAELELAGLLNFLKVKEIPVAALVVNQLELEGESQDKSSSRNETIPLVLQAKFDLLKQNQEARFQLARARFASLKARYPQLLMVPVAMNFSKDGFKILRITALELGN